jgi:hypothetical protein
VIRAVALAAVLGLAACGPAGAPRGAPSDPCLAISLAEYESAAGATKAVARISASGVMDMTIGPMVRQCSSSRPDRVCVNRADLVIRYEPDGAEPFFVRVPAGARYRFDISKRPNTCELLRG